MKLTSDLHMNNMGECTSTYMCKTHEHIHTYTYTHKHKTKCKKTVIIKEGLRRWDQFIQCGGKT